MSRDRRVLLDDPTRPGIPAVIESGGFLFLSSINGSSDNKTGLARPTIFGDGPAQAHNAYRTIVERLAECGYSGADVVRVEHSTSSQEWKLARMALWPDCFGVPTQAVSQGYQGRMTADNMVTVTSIATTGALSRAVVVPGPNDGRAARINRCGPFLFVIGVRGTNNLAADVSVEQISDPYARDITTAYRNIEHHLAAAGADYRNVVRFDAFLRNFDRVREHNEVRDKHFSTAASVSTVVGCPLGDLGEIEVSAIVAIPGNSKEVVSNQDSFGRTIARSVRSGGLIFVSRVDGATESDSRQNDLEENFAHQIQRALDRIEMSLNDFGAPLESMVRLDVYLSDPYQEQDACAQLRARLAGSLPTLAFHGVDQGHSVEVSLTAIAADDDRSAT